MGGMFDTLRNAWKIPDLRKKLFFTVMMLVVFRIGSHIPVPGLDADKFAELLSQGGSLFGLFDIVSGGALKLASIFAMSITPYINATIIMQLLTVAIPRLEQLQKEGEEGRKLIGQFSRYGTVLLGFIQAAGLYLSLSQAVVGGPTIVNFFVITLTFTAGTAFLMWLGEQITEFGIGNGISLIIFGGIVSRGPQGAQALYNLYTSGQLGSGIFGMFALVGIVVVLIAVMMAVIWVNQAERRIPIQYAKRVIGRKMYGGQSTHLPIKVNLAGVIPIIFAMSLMMFPATLIGFFFSQSENPIVLFFKNSSNGIGSALVNAILIIFFTFFYTVIQFNPVEIASNMKKNGGFIPGIRPGKPTSDYIAKVLNRITWFGGFFLAAVTVFPTFIGVATGIEGIWFGGTALLILVGVALETVKQIESQMLMRHYKGFLE